MLLNENTDFHATNNVNPRKDFCYNPPMPSKPKRKGKKTIFDSVRKPTAPPGKKIGVRRPEDKIHPSKRGTKHKEKLERDTGDADL